MRKMKSILLLCALVCLAAALVCTAAAAERTVYVSAAGTGDGASAASPTGSLGTAVAALGGEGGTVVFLSPVTLSAAYTVPEQSGNLTFTAEGSGKLNLAADLTFAKNTNANLITLDLPITASGERVIFGGYNSLHFTAKCEMETAVDFFGGVDTPEGTANITSYAAQNRTLNAKCVTELPYSITVDNGSFGVFAGGNRRVNGSCLLGSIAAPVEITINGGTFGRAVSFTQTSLNKNENAFSVSGMGILADDATLTITGGTFRAPVYVIGRGGVGNSRMGGCSALTMSDRRYYAMDGDITLNITGGTFESFEISAYQTGAGLTQVLRGNFDVHITDGATFAPDTVIDATQVKAYAGADKKATLVYPASLNITPKRFDVVNGAAQTYDEPLRIACIGDSITQGTGAGSGAWDFETKSYPARLLELIEKNGGEAILGNYGIGGSVVMPTNNIWYNDMLNFRLTREECDADWFIIGLGTNDAFNTMVTDGQHARYEEMYTAFIKGYGDLATTKKVFTTSALYRSTAKEKQRQSVLGAVNVRAMQRRATETLAKTSDKYVFVDLYALTFAEAMQVDSKGAAGALLSGDMLHPHAEGYRNVYAPAIYNAIFGGVTAVEGFSTLDTVYVSDTGRIDGAGTADDPIRYIEVAIARLRPGSNAEVRVIGTQTVSTWLTAPDDLASIKFVGVGDGATLTLDGNAKMIRFRTDATIDNLKLNYTGPGAMFVVCNYHNVEITDSVTMPVVGVLAAGHAVYGGSEVYSVSNTDTRYFDTAAAGSSDADAVVTVNGGNWRWIIGGNWRWKGFSPICTYGGNLTINIGAGAQVALSADGQSGACGANYLTGSVKLVTAAPITGTLCDYATITGPVGTTFDCTKNTGSITVETIGAGSIARRVVGDFDGDGVFNARDALIAVSKLLNSSFTAADGAHYFGRSTVTLRDIIWMLKKIA